MNWKLADAKQHLSRVVRLAREEPQILQNRDEPVAAVVSLADFERFREWQRRNEKTLAEAFAELRHTAAEEDWELEPSVRTDRMNPLLGAGDSTRPRSKRVRKRPV